MVLVGEKASPLVLTYFWPIFQEGTDGPFLTIFLQYFSLLLLLLVSAAVNASCGAGFSWLHLWTSGCIAPEETPHRALKFSHLSRTGSTILSTRPGLSSTVLLNFSPEVTCPWFSLVIVLVFQSLCQQLGVWWLEGRSQDIKTSGFSGMGFFLNVDKSAFLSLP